MTDPTRQQAVDLDYVSGVGSPPAMAGLDAVAEQKIAQLAGQTPAGGLALTSEAACSRS